jgi:hypothetical protein
MKNEFTPGPWAVKNFGSNCLLIEGQVQTSGAPAESNAYYSCIASVTQRDEHPRHGGGISRKMCAANARLMAAAPDLYAALLGMVNGAQPLGIERAAYITACKVLAAVEGDIE